MAIGIGNLIRAGRVTRQWSQKDLAARILKEDGTPISAQYLSDIERGHRTVRSEHLIRQIAAALGVKPEFLLWKAGLVPTSMVDITSPAELMEGLLKLQHIVAEGLEAHEKAEEAPTAR